LDPRAVASLPHADTRGRCRREREFTTRG